jgi:hypothetical protein
MNLVDEEAQRKWQRHRTPALRELPRPCRRESSLTSLRAPAPHESNRSPR